MGKIKSALEIALERTESIKVDKGSAGQFEAKQAGKKLANEFLEGLDKSLDEEIKKLSREEQASFKQGLFDVFISQVILPGTKDDLKRIETACQGLNTLIGDKRFGEIIKQLIQFLNQFIEEISNFREAIKKQYAPKLRKKEEELSRRIGRQVKLDPSQDPEFAAIYTQNLNSIKANYQAAVNETREEAQRLFSA